MKCYLVGSGEEVETLPQAAPLRRPDPDQTLAGGVQACQVVHEVLRLRSVLGLPRSCRQCHDFSWYLPCYLPCDVVHDEVGQGPLVVPGHLAWIGTRPTDLHIERWITDFIINCA